MGAAAVGASWVVVVASAWLACGAGASALRARWVVVRVVVLATQPAAGRCIADCCAVPVGLAAETLLYPGLWAVLVDLVRLAF